MKILLPSENMYCYEMAFTLRRFRKPGDVFNGAPILAFHVRYLLNYLLHGAES